MTIQESNGMVAFTLLVRSSEDWADLKVVEDIQLPRIPQIGETVHYSEWVYTVIDVQTVIGENHGKIFVTIQEMDVISQ